MKTIILANRYELNEKIGVGGMAEVYRAVDLVLKRQVAVKLLKQQFIEDQEFITNFDNEAQSAASLNHPNVVHIFDVGTDMQNGQTMHYIVMELIQGKTLKQLIEKDAPLNDSRMVHISKQIASALRAAHRNHIIHRDIKPQNILITENDEVKVTDFGIAKISTSSTITYTSSILGTVHYISPEQAKGKFIDEKSDIYSLGAVMYELMTGQVPFDGENAVAIAISHIQHDLIPPNKINGNISEGLNYIIMKALKKDTSERYQNIDEILNDLKNYENLDTTEPKELDKTMVMPAVKLEEIEKEKSVYQTEEKDENEPEKDNFKRRLLPILLSLLLLGGGFLVVKSFFFSNNIEIEETDIEMPSLLGKKFENAKRQAERMGFEIEIIGYENSGEYAEDLIMEQSETAGATIKKGDIIGVVISSGQEMMRVPNLLGKFQQESEAMIRAAEFEIGEISSDYSDEYGEGQIMAQNPQANTEIPAGSKVSITISLGKRIEVVNMPYLVYSSQSEAIRTLQDLGLRLGNLSEEFTFEYNKGVVMRQSIKAGISVESGSEVDLTISAGPEIVEEEEEPENEVEMEVDYTIHINPPENPDNNEEYTVNILKNDENGSSDYLEKSFAYEDGPQTISFKDKAGLKFELYIDGNFDRTISQ